MMNQANLASALHHSFVDLGELSSLFLRVVFLGIHLGGFLPLHLALQDLVVKHGIKAGGRWRVMVVLV